MDFMILFCALLGFCLLLCLMKSMNRNIEETRPKSSDFTSEQSEQTNPELDNELTDANNEIIRLTQTLDGIIQENSHLAGELEDANQRNKQLRRNLFNVVQSNESAIHALNLTTLSLQMGGLMLQRELNRSKRLLNKYEWLRNRIGTICIEIESKARRRLFKKGIGVPYRFIPGVEQIDLLKDFTEIIESTTKIIEGNYGEEENSQSNVFLSDDLQIDEVDLLTSRLKQSDIQKKITEVIKQKNNFESEVQDDTNLRDFVIKTLKYTKTLTETWSDIEYHQAIVGTVSNFNKLDFHISIPDHTCESMNIKRGIHVPSCYQKNIDGKAGLENSKS